MQQAKREMRNAINELESKKKQPELALPPAQLPLPTAAAKSSRHGKAEPEPEPTQQELADYLRAKLLALSPSDGINDNLEVKFDPSSNTLTIVQPIGRCDHYLGALDANNVSWDIFVPNKKSDSSHELLRLTAISTSGKKARVCFDDKGQPDRETSSNRVRLLFSLAKSEQVPGFQGKMLKTLKKLILISGGAEEKELFQDPPSKSPSANR